MIAGVAPPINPDFAQPTGRMLAGRQLNMNDAGRQLNRLTMRGLESTATCGSICLKETQSYPAQHRAPSYNACMEGCSLGETHAAAESGRNQYRKLMLVPKKNRLTMRGLESTAACGSICLKETQSYPEQHRAQTYAPCMKGCTSHPDESGRNPYRKLRAYVPYKKGDLMRGLESTAACGPICLKDAQMIPARHRAQAYASCMKGCTSHPDESVRNQYRKLSREIQTAVLNKAPRTLIEDGAYDEPNGRLDRTRILFPCAIWPFQDKCKTFVL
jgi:uncharacterized protein YggL (DUF469 family)